MKKLKRLRRNRYKRRKTRKKAKSQKFTEKNLPGSKVLSEAERSKKGRNAKGSREFDKRDDDNLS